ncbi:YciI family protein [Pseudonocardia lacus]|uniref:YciI family protein n=1 Tax=Pseudonocardia lacus TaxID=2835865 RepID=UPI001BDC8346|nr:YciI family protein [Pseudonocardia lacus]
MAVFAVTYTYSADTADTRAEVRPVHRDFLRELGEQGVLLVSGPYADGEPAGALLLFRSESKEELLALLAKDPFQVEGLVSEVVATEWEVVLGPLAQHFPSAS